MSTSTSLIRTLSSPGRGGTAPPSMTAGSSTRRAPPQLARCSSSRTRPTSRGTAHFSAPPGRTRRAPSPPSPARGTSTCGPEGRAGYNGAALHDYKTKCPRRTLTGIRCFSSTLVPTSFVALMIGCARYGYYKLFRLIQYQHSVHANSREFGTCHFGEAASVSRDHDLCLIIGVITA